jgi:hypothetical protein
MRILLLQLPKPDPQIQIHRVLQGRVETTRGVQQGAPEETGRLADKAVIGQCSEVKLATRVILQESRLLVHMVRFTVQEHEIRIQVKMTCHFSQSAGTVKIVGVEPSQDGTTGHSDAFGDGICLASIGFRNPANRAAVPRQDFYGCVSRTPIDDAILDLLAPLLQDTLNGSFQERRLVQGGSYD